MKLLDDPELPSCVFTSKSINLSVHKNQYITVHRVKLLMAKSWKYPGYLSMAEETDKQLYIHTVGEHSTIKRKKLLTHPTIGMNLQKIMFRKKKKAMPKKLYSILFHLNNNIRVTKF